MVATLTGLFDSACGSICKIIGYKKKNHVLEGRLVYEDGIPLRHCHFEFLLKGRIWSQSLGQDYTDKEGQFSLDFTAQQLPLQEKLTLVMHLFEERLPARGAPLGRSLEREMTTLEIYKPIDVPEWQLGDIGVDVYSFSAGFPMLKGGPPPRTASDDRLLLPPQSPLHWDKFLISETEADALVSAARRPDIKPDPRLLRSLLPPPESPTGPVLLPVQPLSCISNSAAFPARMWISLKAAADGWELAEIRCETVSGETRSIAPGDKEFDHALYQLYSMELNRLVTEEYLGTSLLWCGIWAQATQRSWLKQPLKRLLSPHLQHAFLVQGPDSVNCPSKARILPISGAEWPRIREQLLEMLIARVAHAEDWVAAPPSEEWQSPKVQQIFWETISGVVDRFFTENARPIIAFWEEIEDVAETLRLQGLVVDLPKDKNGKPSMQAVEQLKHYCCFTLYVSMYWNWLCIQKISALANPIQAAFIPDSQLPAPAHARSGLEQIVWAHDLKMRQAPALLDEQKGQIYPPLIEALRERQEEFKELGFDLSQMPYGPVGY